MSAPSPSSTGSRSAGERLIARVWHGVTPAARADEYTAYLDLTGVHECRATPGNRGVYVLRRIQHDRAEFTFVSLWESFDAIRRFAGEDYEKARYFPEDREFLIELEPFVEHFEVVGGD